MYTHIYIHTPRPLDAQRRPDAGEGDDLQPVLFPGVCV